MQICCESTKNSSLVSQIGDCNWCEVPESYLSGSEVNETSVWSEWADCLRANMPSNATRDGWAFHCDLPGVSGAEGRAGMKGWMVWSMLAATVVMGCL